MSQKLTFDESLGILTLTISASYSKEDMMASTLAVKSYQSRVERIRLLVDARSATPEMPLADIFDFPDEIYFDQAINRRNLLALLPPVSTRGRKQAEFYVDACENRGRLVKLFDSMEEAIEWLLKPAD